MKATALVVDNDFFFVEFLSEILSRRNYDVIKAYDGREGIEQLKKTAVDIIFVDLLMPKINGTEFIAFARDYLNDINIPVILISGALIEQIDQIQRIGANYYIAKGPFEKTAGHIHSLINTLQQNILPSLTTDNLILPDKFYPRQDTMELVQAMDCVHNIFESMGIGLLVLDRDAHVIRTNRQAMTILQVSLKDTLTQHVAAIFPEAYRNQLVMVLKQIARYSELPKMVFPATINHLSLSVVITSLLQDNQFRGWVVTLCETDVKGEKD